MKVTVKAKPRSKKTSIRKLPDGMLVISFNTPPVDGAANKKIIQLLSEHYNVAKSKIKILKGKSSSIKVVEILTD